jgi:hypothetical protein
VLNTVFSGCSFGDIPALPDMGKLLKGTRQGCPDIAEDGPQPFVFTAQPFLCIVASLARSPSRLAFLAVAAARDRFAITAGVNDLANGFAMGAQD